MALADLCYRLIAHPEAISLFAGLPATNVRRMAWYYKEDPMHRGHLWVADDPGGAILVCDGRDSIAMAVMSRVARYLHHGISQRLDRLITAYLNGYMIPIPQGAGVINFGANVGEVAVVLAALGAKVIAIEPDPNVLPALHANARGRPIGVVPAAAWKEDGPLTLYVKSETADSSVIDAHDQSVTVQGVRIDTLMRGKAPPYLILGDAEGAEPEVLEGAVETLRRTAYVSIRVGPERHGKSSGSLVKPILEAAGFDILHDADETLIGRNRALMSKAA